MSEFLHFEPNDVRAVAEQLMAIAEGTRQELSSMASAANSMEWQAQARGLFDADFASIVFQLQGQSDSLEDLASLLTREIAKWEGLGLRLEGGDRLGEITWWMPVAGGGTTWWPQDGRLLSVGVLGASLSVFAGNLPLWIRRILGLDAPKVQPISTPVRRAPSVGFGELLRENQEPSVPPDPRVATVSAEAATETEATGGWDVRPITQIGLKYQGQDTQFGCVAASTAMILEYWHRQNPSNPAMSAQDILNANVREEVFKGTGMSIDAVKDEVEDLGYTAELEVHKGVDDLVGALKEGPVIVNVRLGMSKTTYPHAMVLTGISGDRQQVRVADPWTDRVDTYSWDRFSASWGSVPSDNKPGNIYLKISPAK